MHLICNRLDAIGILYHAYVCTCMYLRVVTINQFLIYCTFLKHPRQKVVYMIHIPVFNLLTGNENSYR